MRRKWLSLLAGLTAASFAAAPVAAQVDERRQVDLSGGIMDEEILDEVAVEKIGNGEILDEEIIAEYDVDEIVVVGSRSGDPNKTEAIYAEMLRKQAREEFDRSRAEEQEGWRKANLTYQSSKESRIVWGYDPKVDHDRREDFDLTNSPNDIVKPATLFRAQF